MACLLACFPTVALSCTLSHLLETSVVQSVQTPTSCLGLGPNVMNCIWRRLNLGSPPTLRCAILCVTKERGNAGSGSHPPLVVSARVLFLLVVLVTSPAFIAWPLTACDFCTCTSNRNSTVSPASWLSLSELSCSLLRRYGVSVITLT